MRGVLAAIEARDTAAAAASMQRFFALSLAYLDRVHTDVMTRRVAWSDSDL
jgi:DNA-binding GntR family transcriptional regulator